MNTSILIVDDEKHQRDTLSDYLSSQKNTVTIASGVEEAVQILKSKIIDIVFTDFKMPGKNGLDLLREIKIINPDTQVVIMTAFGTIENAVTAMKEGAFDYITKPIDLDEIDLLIKRIDERQNLLSENIRLKEQLKDRYKLSGVISSSAKMEEVISIASRVAESKAAVLIRGESGTGKEVLAKAIHFSSERKEKPFIAVNCAALNENLLESELFGHEKGAFTGADKQKRGRFELANEGTLLLDEIGDLPAATQVKLLRILQEEEFERVGGVQPIKVDVRILAATNRDIEQLIDEGKFREDLYYRLNVVTINIPPLRERREDIPTLIDFFLNKYISTTKKSKAEFSKEAFDILMRYNYPGNVRELENIVHHSLVLSREELITSEDIPISLRKKRSESGKPCDELDLETPMSEQVDSLEKKLVKEAMERTKGNQTGAAKILGIPERNLRYRLEKWGWKNNS